MPKAPKDGRPSRTKNPKKYPRHQNASFREVLGLSTSDADINTFKEIKQALRDLIFKHYDWNRSDREQSDATRAAFAAEVAMTMPHLYATEQTCKETKMYVSRHFSNVSWMFRNRKSAPQKDTNANLVLEDDKEAGMDETAGFSALNRSCRPRGDQLDIIGDANTFQTHGPRNANDGIMLEDDMDEDMDPPADVPSGKRRGRPRKKKPSVSKAGRTNILQPTNRVIPTSPSSLPASPTPFPSSSAPSPFPVSSRGSTCEPPPSYVTLTEEPVRKFLRSCKPNLDHLFPVFVRAGLGSKVDLEGILDWPAKERISWLMELCEEKWGISRMNVKTLSLAFEVTGQYEAMLVAAGVNPRG